MTIGRKSSLRFWGDIFHDREFTAGRRRDHLTLDRLVDFSGEILDEDECQRP
jgi:hypothetical protein